MRREGSVRVRVPGEIKRSRGGRWSWTLKLAQKRSWAGRWRWSAKVGLLSLRVFPQQQCNGHCPCDSARAVETAIAQCTSRWAMARGHRLSTSIVLAAVHGLSGLFRAVHAVEPSLFCPLPTPLPVPNKPSRFCGRKAKCTHVRVHSSGAVWESRCPLALVTVCP